MRLSRWTLLLLALTAVSMLAMVEGTGKPVPARSVTVAELEKLAGIPSIEQVILRAAAAKVRTERKPLREVEVQLTATIRATPNGCYEICVGSGIHRACFGLCNSEA